MTIALGRLGDLLVELATLGRRRRRSRPRAIGRAPGASSGWCRRRGRRRPAPAAGARAAPRSAAWGPMPRPRLEESADRVEAGVGVERRAGELHDERPDRRARSASSAARRDLPTPASPVIRTLGARAGPAAPGLAPHRQQHVELGVAAHEWAARHGDRTGRRSLADDACGWAAACPHRAPSGRSPGSVSKRSPSKASS